MSRSMASAQAIGAAKLAEQLATIVQESGSPESFDAAAWISRWLSDPVPALGGARPIDLVGRRRGRPWYR